jgi:fumarate hydratase, class II
MSTQRWGRQTQLAVGNFAISGEPMPSVVLRALAHIKQHAATANAAFGVLDASLADAIAAAAYEVRRGEFADQFPVDVFQTGSGTSSNMNVNEVIAHRAAEMLGSPVHPVDHVNASQSSNDVFPTALRLAVLGSMNSRVLPALSRLKLMLDVVSVENNSTVKAGRTHLMDAAPMTFGQEVGGWARSVQLAMERMESVVPRMSEMPLGGTAVGTGLNAPAGFAAMVIRGLADDLGLSLREAVNHFEAQSSQEPLLETSAALRGVALCLFKIAGDLRLLASGPMTGLNELELPELQAGSSIMPGKVNPVIPEVVQQIAAQVVGNDAAVAFASATGSTLQLCTAMPVMARNVLESLHLVTAAATSLTEKCLGDLKVNRDVMGANAQRSPAVAAALNPIIGYEAAGRIARQAIAERRPVLDVAIECGEVVPDLARRLDPLRLALEPDALASGRARNDPTL